MSKFRTADELFRDFYPSEEELQRELHPNLTDEEKAKIREEDAIARKEGRSLARRRNFETANDAIYNSKTSSQAFDNFIKQMTDQPLDKTREIVNNVGNEQAKTNRLGLNKNDLYWDDFKQTYNFPEDAFNPETIKTWDDVAKVLFHNQIDDDFVGLLKYLSKRLKRK